MKQLIILSEPKQKVRPHTANFEDLHTNLRVQKFGGLVLASQKNIGN